MNKVILVGRLTRDVELRFGSSGLAIGKTAIAVSRKYKTQSGEYREDAMFIDLTFFGKTAEFANKYFRKGSGIVVDGRLQLEQWQDQSGQKRSKHSVAVENVEFPPKDNSQNQGDFNNGNSYGNQPQSGGYQQQGSGYNNSNQYGSGNQYNSQNQQGSYGNQQPQPQQKSSSDVPDIDINSDIDDQVPF